MYAGRASAAEVNYDKLPNATCASERGAVRARGGVSADACEVYAEYDRGIFSLCKRYNHDNIQYTKLDVLLTRSFTINPLQGPNALVFKHPSF